MTRHICPEHRGVNGSSCPDGCAWLNGLCVWIGEGER